VFTEGNFRLFAIERDYEFYPTGVEFDEAKDWRIHSLSRVRVRFQEPPQDFLMATALQEKTKIRQSAKTRMGKTDCAIAEKSSTKNILNCDETCSRLYPSIILRWAENGSQSMKIEITGQDETSITAMATITADHQKLTL
jgi:hypothetical protein